MSEIRIAALKDQNEIMRAYNNELRAEVERLRIENQQAWNECEKHDEARRHAVAEVGRLKAALEKIANEIYGPRTVADAQYYARAALADQGKG